MYSYESSWFTVKCHSTPGNEKVILGVKFSWVTGIDYYNS